MFMINDNQEPVYFFRLLTSIIRNKTNYEFKNSVIIIAEPNKLRL